MIEAPAGQQNLVSHFTLGSTALCPPHAPASELFRRWFSDEELTTNMGGWEFRPFPTGDASPVDYVRRCRESTWLIGSIAGDGRIAPIGFAGLHVWQRHRIGIFRIAIVERLFRGQGHARRATQLVLRWAFRYLDLVAVHLTVTSSNTAAIALYEKCGFRECGRFRQARFQPGGRFDEVQMELLREEWETTEAAS